MNKINLELPFGRMSSIAIGESIDNLLAYIGDGQSVIVTDTDVYDLYCPRFPKESRKMVIQGGEKNKTLDTITFVLQELILLKADRSCTLVGVGGGIVCDITGFAASIYMRGLRFGFVASTLLAQADASVGGKNGVNFKGYKNMVGVFNQPEFVICDTDMLRTLPAREICAGMAEIVKTALLADKHLFDLVTQRREEILRCDAPTMTELVTRSVQIKAEIVKADEREAGERRKLNLGHTFGHAIEKNSQLLHGEAVSIGMAITADISQRLGLLSPEENGRIKRLLQSLGLPVEINVPKEVLLNTIALDKKRHGDKLHFVLNKGIGDAEVRTFDYGEMAELVSSIDIIRQ